MYKVLESVSFSNGKIKFKDSEIHKRFSSRFNIDKDGFINVTNRIDIKKGIVFDVLGKLDKHMIGLAEVYCEEAPKIKVPRVPNEL